VADHIYEVGGTFTSTTSHPILTIIAKQLASGVRIPEIREIGLTLNTATAVEYILGVPANTPATPTSPLTVVSISHIDEAGDTQVGFSTWSTTPTAPTAVARRVQLPATIGAGVIWVWNPGEWPLYPTPAPNQFVTLWQSTTTPVTLDWYIKVAE
jgi:hypothetical protein